MQKFRSSCLVCVMSALSQTKKNTFFVLFLVFRFLSQEFRITKISTRDSFWGKIAGQQYALMKSSKETLPSQASRS